LHFENGDILVVAQKIVSKAEGAVVRLATVAPSPQARAIAERQKEDPRLVEVILKESRRLVRSDPVRIAEPLHGYVCANRRAWIIRMFLRDAVTLLPEIPDRSAKNLAVALRKNEPATHASSSATPSAAPGAWADERSHRRVRRARAPRFAGYAGTVTESL